jgi:hypothetical protein
MKFSSLILPAINALVWGALSWMGWEGIKFIESQHTAGYPNLGQIGYYLATPLVMLIVALVPGALLSQTKWSVLGNVWSSFALIAAVPYFLLYGGGV